MNRSVVQLSRPLLRHNFHLSPVATSLSAVIPTTGATVLPLVNARRGYKSYTDQIAHANLTGFDLLYNADLNKGLAFSEKEREQYKLKGLLPAGKHNQAHQVKLVIEQIREFRKDLNKYVYLRNLQDNNKHLFYLTIQMYPDELMPVIYTPVVGLACQHYSRIYSRPRGMFITIEDLGKLDKLFANWGDYKVKAIVVTDGERTLGLGDLGAHAMAISVGKMALYSAIGGISPHLTLPVCIDVGTNNEQLLHDPYYIGLHEKRVQGAEYDALIDEFMQCVVKKYGEDCLVQFEDFGNKNAQRLLEKYRNKYCMFNDDIQGTASVSLAGILASNRITDMKVSQHQFLFQGAGTAAVGIASLIVQQMIREGLSEAEAVNRIWMSDIDGVVSKSRSDTDAKMRFAKDVQPMNLEQTVQHIKPTCLIGVSAATGTFTPSILKMMAEFNQKPLIMALSNPTSKAECTADDAYQYTDGRCIFASGSPFPEIEYKGKTFEPSQGNNAYIFPAVASAVMACGVKRITDDVFIEAAKALAEEVTDQELSIGRLYPRLSHVCKVTLKIAAKLSDWFYQNEFATRHPEPEDKYKYLKMIQYNPYYDDSFDYFRLFKPTTESKQ